MSSPNEETSERRDQEAAHLHHRLKTKPETPTAPQQKPIKASTTGAQTLRGAQTGVAAALPHHFHFHRDYFLNPSFRPPPPSDSCSLAVTNYIIYLFVGFFSVCVCCFLLQCLSVLRK